MVNYWPLGQWSKSVQVSVNLWIHLISEPQHDSRRIIIILSILEALSVSAYHAQIRSRLQSFVQIPNDGHIYPERNTPALFSSIFISLKMYCFPTYNLKARYLCKHFYFLYNSPENEKNSPDYHKITLWRLTYLYPFTVSFRYTSLYKDSKTTRENSYCSRK